MTPRDEAFVARRSRLVAWWPATGAALLALVLALAAFLWNSAPQLIDPRLVAAALESGTLAPSTLHLMALLLPFVVLMFLGFASAVILLGFAAFANERRLLRLLREARDE